MTLINFLTCVENSPLTMASGFSLYNCRTYIITQVLYAAEYYCITFIVFDSGQGHTHRRFPLTLFPISLKWSFVILLLLIGCIYSNAYTIYNF